MEGEQCAADDPLTCAQKAIIAALGRIRDEPAVGYHLGRGSNTFGLLTEAFAKLTGRTDLDQVRVEWSPRKPKDPREAPALGRMTVSQFAGLTERLRNATASLNSMALARFTGADTVESNIEQLSEDCGLSADAVRHLVRIAAQEL